MQKATVGLLYVDYAKHKITCENRQGYIAKESVIEGSVFIGYVKLNDQWQAVEHSRGFKLWDGFKTRKACQEYTQSVLATLTVEKYEEQIALREKDVADMQALFDEKNKECEENIKRIKEEEAKAKQEEEQTHTHEQEKEEGKQTMHNGRYFDDVSTAEELKAAYKKWAMELHPDRNPNGHNDFIEMKKQYEEALKRIKEGGGKAAENINLDERFMEVVDALMKYPNLTIRIVGTWIWIDADKHTYAIKDVLGELGFRYSRKSKQWFMGDTMGGVKKGYKSKTHDERVKTYGEQVFRTAKQKAIQA